VDIVVKQWWKSLIDSHVNDISTMLSKLTGDVKLRATQSASFRNFIERNRRQRQQAASPKKPKSLLPTTNRASFLPVAGTRHSITREFGRHPSPILRRVRSTTAGLSPERRFIPGWRGSIRTEGGHFANRAGLAPMR
jgi:hypothetical protein